MWPLLKSELLYHKISISFFSIVYLTLSIVVFNWGWSDAELDIPGIQSIMVVTGIIIIFVRYFRLVQEKSDRYFSTLPLAFFKVGLEKNIYGVFIWIILSLIYWTVLAVFRFESINLRYIFDFISVSGLFIAGNAILLSMRDLNYSITAKYQKIVLSAIYAVIIISAALIFSIASVLRYFPALPVDSIVQVRTYFAGLYATAPGAITLLFLGLVLTYLEAIVFNLRKWYLE